MTSFGICSSVRSAENHAVKLNNEKTEMIKGSEMIRNDAQGTTLPT